ncbi:MAG: sulfurtransferase TusA family protein [Bacteriovoracaceae bacterium]|nr:sulfurtransferase TusA family protein [Bacteriovoracaceae bacterium]
MKKVDARGLSCPTPLVMTIEAMKHEDVFDVLIDDEVAKENILRMLKGKFNMSPIFEEKNGEIIIHVKK